MGCRSLVVLTELWKIAKFGRRQGKTSERRHRRTSSKGRKVPSTVTGDGRPIRVYEGDKIPVIGINVDISGKTVPCRKRVSNTPDLTPAKPPVNRVPLPVGTIVLASLRRRRDSGSSILPLTRGSHRLESPLVRGHPCVRVSRPLTLSLQNSGFRSEVATVLWTVFDLGQPTTLPPTERREGGRSRDGHDDKPSWKTLKGRPPLDPFQTSRVKVLGSRLIPSPLRHPYKFGVREALWESDPLRP